MFDLDRFLEEQRSSFDIAKFFSADIKQIDESTPPPLAYKYYSSERADFFSNPIFRFSQRAALNDPFEFTKRWEKFASKELKEEFAKHLRGTFRSLGINSPLITRLLINESLKRGIFLSDVQLEEIRNQLRTKNGKRKLNEFFQEQAKLIEPFIELSFAHMDLGFEAYLDKFSREFGIFSVSETASNEQLWGLYAQSGRGFCVEISTDGQFLTAKNGRSLLWPVKYTDEEIDSFFTNPFFLFLVKSEKWSFEKEWRTISPLSNCEGPIGFNSDVYFRRPQPGDIRGINFGYSYDNEMLARHAATILAFDPNIIIRKAVADTRIRKIEFVQLLP